MKVILNTIDGKEVVLTERSLEKDTSKGKTFAFEKTCAVIQVEQLKLEFDTNELLRAVNAMWGKDREYELSL
ncbi:hypothetical protein LCGC14_0925880 [marine sediment metagenome]|uniref:Uncharacterized protein n=1 Tax=marine sediment metagenome TaxID=412755 RepID=A0A0F9RW36_9ZZZZ